MTLKTKVPLIAVLLCLTSCALIGGFGYVQSRNALFESAVERLGFIAETKRDRLARVMSATAGSLDGMARSEGVFQGIESLAVAIDADEIEAVRALYTDPALTPLQRAEITGETAKGMYSWRHTGLHASFVSQWRSAEISDAYVVLPDGRIIYSVTKSDGFLNSLSNLGRTPLAGAAERALTLPAGEHVFVDFAAYESGLDAVSAFWAQPVYRTAAIG